MAATRPTHQRNNIMSEEQKTEQNNATQEQPKERHIMCPCCHQMTLPEVPNKLNPQLVDHYMACVLSGVPFNHEYPLFDGRILVTASAPSPEQKQAADQLVSILNGCQSQLIIERDNMRGMIRIMMGIMEIKLNPGRDDMRVYHPATALTEMLTQLKEYMNSYPEEQDGVAQKLKQLTGPDTASGVPPHVLLAVTNAHASITAILNNIGFDRNFWKGIELA